MQKPHPRIWIPGVSSRETIIWAAQHRYPYIALNTPVERTNQIWKMYDDAAAEAGFTGGPEYHGLLKQIHVAETEEKALENARQFLWMQRRIYRPGAPGVEHARGLLQPGEPPRLRRVPRSAARKLPRARPALEGQLQEMMIIAGTPKQVIAKLRVLLEQTRPGIFAFWGNDGTVSHADTRRPASGCWGEEVFPAVREMAKEFDLKSPFETGQPVSVRYMGKAEKVERAAAGWSGKPGGPASSPIRAQPFLPVAKGVRCRAD